MYVPSYFAETRPEVLRELIGRHPLGALVVPTADGLLVNHIPFLVEGEVLRAHVARANPLWQQVLTGPAVAIFQGPGGYITPSWYASKAETGKAVPTWNYVVVHAHGPVRFVEDRGWLRAHVERLVAFHEKGRSPAWEVTDAPADFIEKMLGGIVGLELAIERLEGKWKLGQNRDDADRRSMVEGLRGDADPAARALAELIGRG
jgi:transcriptional regulator